MTMLEIMKGRIPAGVELTKATEKPGRYDIVLSVDGMSGKSSLPKTCTPGKAEMVADFAVNAAMMDLYFKTGDKERVKFWLDKQSALTVE